MLARGSGFVLIAAGLALTYNFCSAPASRLGGHQFDLLMFFGPVVLVFGVLLARTSRPNAGAVPDWAQAKFLYGSLALVAVPVGLLVVSFLTMSSNRGLSGTAGMMGIFAVVLLGLPGLVLLAVYGFAHARKAH